MRLFIFSWLLAMCLFGALQATHFFEQPINIYELAVGYRHDNFKWSMKGICKHPDVLWKMRWKTLRMTEVTAGFSWATCSNYYIRVNTDYARIYQGEERSSGYRCNDEKGEYSRIKGDADRGHAMDFTGGVGYQFTSNGSRVTAAPIIGWAYHSQSLTVSNGDQEINTGHRHHHHRHHHHHHHEFMHPVHRRHGPCCECPECRRHNRGRVGKIPDLHVRYSPHWHGPWLGIDVAAFVDVPCTILYGTLEYHWSQQYRARGRWQLNHSFLNTFRHHTNGRGVVAKLGLMVSLGCNWWLGVIGQYRNFNTSKGKHRSNTIRVKHHERHKVFGTFPIIPKRDHTELREIHWNSWSVAASVNYRM